MSRVMWLSVLLLSAALTHVPVASGAPKSARGIKPIKLKCEDFLALDELVKPKVVYFTGGFIRSAEPDDAALDVETTDRLVPVVVEICRKNPKASFWKKMKAELKKEVWRNGEFYPR